MTRCIALAAALALSGCALPPAIAGAVIGAGATIAVSWTQADVTMLGWYPCQRGNPAACASSGVKPAGPATR